MSTTTPTRKKPIQARSKARVETILATAKDLIAAEGSDAMKMSDVASAAGVPIGSVYQYFPDKNAIIQTLAEEMMTRVHAGLKEQFSGISSVEEAVARSDETMDAYYQMFLDEPVVRDIWCSTQGSKLLQEMDIADSRANGEVLFEQLKPLIRKKNWERAEASCFMLMQLTGAAVRLAVAVDRKTGDLMIEEYKRLMRTSLEGLQ